MIGVPALAALVPCSETFILELIRAGHLHVVRGTKSRYLLHDWYAERVLPLLRIKKRIAYSRIFQERNA